MQLIIEDLTKKCDAQVEQIKNLEADKRALEECLSSQTEKLKDFVSLQYDSKQLKQLLLAVETPNPRLAIEMLKTKRIETYIYACKSLEAKQELFKEAINTSDDRVISTVARFLRFSVSDASFGEMVMDNKNKTVAEIFLKDLLIIDYEDFQKYCLRHNKYDIYIDEKLKRALKIDNKQDRIKELESCLEFAKQYCKHKISVIEDCLKGANPQVNVYNTKNNHNHATW